MKLYAKSKVDMMFQKMLKIQQKSGIDKIGVFYKNKKIKKIKNFGEELTHPASAKNGGGGV